MTGNPLHTIRIAGRVCALAGALALLTGCGFKLAGPEETVSVPTLATEDLDGPCKFEINMPDQALTTIGETPAPNTIAPAQVAVLVVYERGDSSDLFNDTQVQNLAATMHLATVFAHQCNSKVTGDIQSDATKGPGRTLFAALTQASGGRESQGGAERILRGGGVVHNDGQCLPGSASGLYAVCLGFGVPGSGYRPGQRGCGEDPGTGSGECL